MALSTSVLSACNQGEYLNSGSCQSCIQGYFCPGDNIKYSCNSGYFSSAGAVSCDICPAGTYSSSISSSCTNCPSGSISASPGSSACTQCSAGYYSDSAGQVCNQCSAGTFSAVGSGSCTQCPAGKYSLIPSSSCTSCSAGSYSTIGSATCTLCSAGTYSASSGAGSCSNCTAGRYSLSGSTSCTACSAGTYSLIAGSGSCTNCDAGQYSASGATSCTNCSAGTYSNSGLSSCINCPVGQFSLAGSSTCTYCVAGTYAANIGTISCTSCAAGKYSLVGATSCSNCDAGTYSSSGSGSCTSCPAGKYSTAGAASCTDCSAGQYSTSGSSICLDCPAGQYSSTGSSTCSQCSSGTYSSNIKSSICTNCQAGKYSLIGATACINCDPGTYSATQGSGSCPYCAAGTFSSAGSSSCTLCPSGKYSNTGSSSCSVCPSGGICAAGGCSSCTTCADGTIPNSSATTCNICPAGTYSQAGWTACQNCTPGYYSSPNAGSCIQCSGGYICNQNKCTSCSKCSAGTHSSIDFTTCEVCPAGTFASSGSSLCTTCPVNTYSGSNASSCTLCNAGFYSSAGASTCYSICGDGLRVGSEECDDANIQSNDGCSSLCVVETGYSCIGGSSLSIDSCTPICGDGLRVGSEACDDKNVIPGDGCSNTCIIEAYWRCSGGSVNSKDICQPICGDGFHIQSEQCDDCNLYSNDGCSSACEIQYGYECNIYDETTKCQKCNTKCGNGFRVESDPNSPPEQCDDGNTFDYDGCSHNCTIELGYICTGGSPTTKDVCIENQFMPSATLQVLSNNNLIIKFNDTIKNINPDENDLYIAIYGPSSSYDFSWTASFQNSSTLNINMKINSEITGAGEKVYIEFPYSNRFLSVYSLRQTNPDIVLSNSLKEASGNQASSSFGQTTLYIYSFSVAISLVSLFGGNSIELMWILTNYLQLIFFISTINVIYPTLLDNYFPYVQICNANNPYLSYASFFIIPESKFKRGDVSNSIGSKAFYVSSSDKIPWLLPCVLLLCAVLLTNLYQPKENQKCVRFLYKLLGYLKYDFFLRLCIELELDIAFNSIVNLYFYDFSSIYEIISFCLALLFMMLGCTFVIFSTYFIISKRKVLQENSDSLKNYACLFCEVKFEDEASSYFILVFFIRRLYFCIGMIVFYHSKDIQIIVCITSSLLSLVYMIKIKPYKAKILNFYSSCNETFFLVLSCLTFIFDENKTDSNSPKMTDFQIFVGYAFLGIICIFIYLNLIYLIPLKALEICALINKTFTYCFSKTKIHNKHQITKTENLNREDFIFKKNSTVINTLSLNSAMPRVHPLNRIHQAMKIKNEIDFSFRSNAIVSNINIIEVQKKSQIESIFFL